MNVCIYGGQYGSEGKGSLASYYGPLLRDSSSRVIAVTEGGPNSGHVGTKGKLRQLPVSAFWADAVLVSPAATISIPLLKKEIDEVNLFGRVFVHEHAGIMLNDDGSKEGELVQAISSTGSGTGYARMAKAFNRDTTRIAASYVSALRDAGALVLNRLSWSSYVNMNKDSSWLFECSQGLLLDNEWGVYPYVTSRSTHPVIATTRAGLHGRIKFKYAGVFRTYPIRTGGPSGPTGGDELQWSDVGVTPEVASVTKRVRRVFQFSDSDFWLSYSLVKPDVVAFTHLDYVGAYTAQGFQTWLHEVGIERHKLESEVLVSHRLGQFREVL